ncbi:MAG TPA: hypothetical protein PLR83_11480, partial [Pyrinomonadaceae bacterium]|nr:hypothetical protein [Pyrinomonadaceae bacterium]
GTAKDPKNRDAKTTTNFIVKVLSIAWVDLRKYSDAEPDISGVSQLYHSFWPRWEFFTFGDISLLKNNLTFVR